MSIFKSIRNRVAAAFALILAVTSISLVVDGGLRAESECVEKVQLLHVRVQLGRSLRFAGRHKAMPAEPIVLLAGGDLDISFRGPEYDKSIVNPGAAVPRPKLFLQNEDGTRGEDLSDMLHVPGNSRSIRREFNKPEYGGAGGNQGNLKYWMEVNLTFTLHPRVVSGTYTLVIPGALVGNPDKDYEYSFRLVVEESPNPW